MRRAHVEHQAGRRLVRLGARAQGRGQIGADTLAILHDAYRRYDEIFSEPVRRACLIHGDYNAWNVLLNPQRTHAIAVLDPFGAGWADPEKDLYQLESANGRELGLLDAYRAQARLSPLFEVKRRFYEAFTEAMHYCDANVDASRSHLKAQAEALRDAMRREGI